MTYPRLLAERYELGELLGHGGMAEVHRGRDVRLGREVAVKVLRSDLARDPTFQTRFRREAQAAAALNHPAIVAVYDTGEDIGGTNGPTPYIVMEYVEGRTLREVLKAEGRLMPQRAMEITADVCAALDFSHRNGIVHRDVKPGNVMITRTGGVKVMDFGIARALTDSAATVTATAQVIGTAQYLSPEQARGENVDARSDVYSTGCLLYELLTGSPPFTGDSPVAVAYQHVREAPKPPSSINPDVPAQLDAIVLKSMAKNPANRYQSAGLMRTDLQRALAGQPVLAEPVMSAAERTSVFGAGAPTEAFGARPEEPGRSGRRKAAYVLLVLAVIAILAGGAFAATRLLGDGGTTRVAVPDLTGLTQSQARHRLHANDLTLGKVTSRRSRAQNKGKVVDQTVESGTRLKHGSRVGIVVGAGPQTVSVPDVRGSTIAAATGYLRQVGLRVDPSPVYQPSQQPAGIIIDTRPTPGQQVGHGSQVALIVSTGKLPMPSVIGKSYGDAVNMLKRHGFTNYQRHDVHTNNAAAGTVVGQDPAGGSQQPVSALITLSVAVPAPTPTPTTAPPTTTPPPGTTPPNTTPPPTGTPTLPTPGPGGHHNRR